jgi:hypothetical protein
MQTRRSFKSILILAFTLLLLVPFLGVAHSQGVGNNQPPGETISPKLSRLIAQVREATAGYRNFDAIGDAGYSKFLDCFVNYQVGGMGQHYVNGDLAGDAVLDPMKPEVLVYEPTESGDMILVALEYLMFASQWDPGNTGRAAPVLFDQPFHLETDIPDTPPVWALHLWLWTDNPEGLFADFNPLVFCPINQPITNMTPRTSSRTDDMLGGR